MELRKFRVSDSWRPSCAKNGDTFCRIACRMCPIFQRNEKKKKYELPINRFHEKKKTEKNRSGHLGSSIIFIKSGRRFASWVYLIYSAQTLKVQRVVVQSYTLICAFLKRRPYSLDLFIRTRLHSASIQFKQYQALKGHCHAIWQLYKKLGDFASIEFQN